MLLAATTRIGLNVRFERSDMRYAQMHDCVLVLQMRLRENRAGGFLSSFTTTVPAKQHHYALKTIQGGKFKQKCILAKVDIFLSW